MADNDYFPDDLDLEQQQRLISSDVAGDDDDDRRTPVRVLWPCFDSC
jgi:hypothetical protein